MARAIITADPHFGVPGRLRDILYAMRVMRQYAADHSIDVIIILGDTFHDRKSIDIETLSACADFFEETKNHYNQTWITFPGNHDMFLRHSWAVNSIKILCRHMTVIDTAKILTLDDQRFWILPFIQNERSYMKILGSIERQIRSFDVLFTHIGVCKALFNPCFLLRDWSIVSFEDSPFYKVYTGHFHVHQQVNKVTYPGSPIPFKADEGDVPHGFLDFDIGKLSHTFINIWEEGAKIFPGEILPPQFMSVLDDQIEQLTEIDVHNNVVRIALSRDWTADELRQLRQRFLGMGARKVNWMHLKVEKAESHHAIAELGIPTQRNMFQEIVERDVASGQIASKGLSRGLIYRLHDEIVKEGDDVYLAQEQEL